MLESFYNRFFFRNPKRQSSGISTTFLSLLSSGGLKVYKEKKIYDFFFYRLPFGTQTRKVYIH